MYMYNKCSILFEKKPPGYYPLSCSGVYTSVEMRQQTNQDHAAFIKDMHQ